MDGFIHANIELMHLTVGYYLVGICCLVRFILETPVCVVLAEGDSCAAGSLYLGQILSLV